MSDTMTTDVSVDAGESTTPQGSSDVDQGALDFSAAKGVETQAVGIESAEAAQTEPGGELYTVKVGGEERQVTLDELQSGYMMQADYTRKTQEVAQRAKELQQAEALALALERDPHGTVQALADAYGISFQQAQAAVQNAQQDGGDEYVDPVQRELQEVKQQLNSFTESQQQAAARAQIQRELNELQQSYGDFDQNELIMHAMRKGIDLPTAYRDLNFERGARREQATEEKRQAQAVASGATTQRGVVKQPQAKPKTAREAVIMSLRQAGVEV